MTTDGAASNDTQANLVAAVEVALTPRTPKRPWWEYASMAAGAAAGLGLIVVVAGAIAMWIRLAGAGLPADAGVSAQSAGTLAGIGMHDLLFWIVLNAVFAIGGDRILDSHYRTVAAAVAQGRPASEIATASPLTKVATAMERLQESKLFNWIKAPLKILLITAALPYALFDRLGLWWLWVVIIFPFDISWIAPMLATFAAIRWSWRKEKATSADELCRARASSAVAFMLAATVAGLSGEVGPGPHFPLVAARLSNQQEMRGKYIAYNDGTLYLGVGHSLRVIPAADLKAFSVTNAPDHTKTPKSLVVRLLDLVI